MVVQSYDPDAVIRSAERALGKLQEMEQKGTRIQEAVAYLEPVVDTEEVEERGVDIYDSITKAYRTLSHHENYLESPGVQLDQEHDRYPLRNAVSALEPFSKED